MIWLQNGVKIFVLYHEVLLTVYHQKNEKGKKKPRQKEVVS